MSPVDIWEEIQSSYVHFFNHYVCIWSKVLNKKKNICGNFFLRHTNPFSLHACHIKMVCVYHLYRVLMPQSVIVTIWLLSSAFWFILILFNRFLNVILFWKDALWFFFPEACEFSQQQYHESLTLIKVSKVQHHE